MKNVAYLAGGCFWGLEELFRTQKGILEINAGYTGGTKMVRVVGRLLW